MLNNWVLNFCVCISILVVVGGVGNKFGFCWYNWISWEWIFVKILGIKVINFWNWLIKGGIISNKNISIINVVKFKVVIIVKFFLIFYLLNFCINLFKVVVKIIVVNINSKSCWIF